MKPEDEIQELFAAFMKFYVLEQRQAEILRDVFRAGYLAAKNAPAKPQEEERFCGAV
jgi:hypothetical protein